MAVMSTKPFHHGNLRESLLQLAVAEVEKVGGEALSMRELAKILGVSRAAPYRHFESKDELLSALAEAGLEALLQLYRDKTKTLVDAPPELSLRAACEAYLEFAKKSPELYRIMFSSRGNWQALLSLADTSRDGAEEFAEPLGVQSASFLFFEQLVRAALNDAEPQKVRTAALVSWCVLHGNAMLGLDGLLDKLDTNFGVQEAILTVASRVARIFEDK